MQTTTSTSFDPASLVDSETGELDLIAIRDRADVLASRDFGAANYPPSYRRSREMNVTEQARAVRVLWRQARGLPDDTPCTMVDVPVWGASGDGFGAAR
jgi:hypothetical protein